MSSRRSAPVRDQNATPFSEILAELCHAAGARCAALVDAEGETVDYGGEGDPFDIRILAAEWRLVLQHMGDAPVLGSSQEFIVRARHKSFLIEALPEGYALVMQLGRRATRASSRALCQARRRLCAEAGFEDRLPPHGDWTKVRVQEDPGQSKRPLRLATDEQEHDVTVIGRIAASPGGPRESSFRVRLSSGEERTLVREPFGHWYLEEERWT